MASVLDRAQAALYDAVLARGERKGMAARRARLLQDVRGRVLEIGAGTGLNAADYPAGLDRLVLTEPDHAMAGRLHARAPAGAEVVECGAEALPFDDGAFDVVVATLVLCTVPDPAGALAEIRRVLAPGGELRFIEHVRADRGPRRVAQRLAHHPWRLCAAGCRCDQDTAALLRTAGFESEPERDRWQGMPPIVAPLIVGVARPTG